MIYGKVFEAMTEKEKRNYKEVYKRYVDELQAYSFEQDELIKAQHRTIEAQARLMERESHLAGRGRDLQDYIRKMEDLYQDLLPKPMMAAENYKPDTKGDTE